MGFRRDGVGRFLCSGHAMLSSLVSLILLMAFIAGLAAWPAFREVSQAGFSSLSRPWLAFFGIIPEPSRVSSGAEQLAVRARSMEFRVQQYHVQPASIQTWSAEWGSNPSQQLLLLRLLLQQLPEIGAREATPLQRQDLIQSIQGLNSGLRKLQPDNSFLLLAEALVCLYSGQDAAATAALKEAERLSRMETGLEELNRSEYALWQKDRHGILFPSTCRVWSLQLERPLHMLSRSLALQEKASLQKYNLERATELVLLHIHLAAQIAESSWAPSDQAIARSMANRALEPFWSGKDFKPASAQLEENFLKFLEDQGDSLASAKARAWFSILNSQEDAMTRRIPVWRYVQQLACWTASSVLGGLFLQTTSLALALITLVFAARFPSALDLIEEQSSSGLQIGMATVGFGLGPIGWAVSGQQTSGSFQFLGLLGGWILWGVVMLMTRPKLSLTACRSALQVLLIAFLMATVLATASAALVLQYRQAHLQFIAEHGWLR